MKKRFVKTFAYLLGCAQRFNGGSYQPDRSVEKEEIHCPPPPTERGPWWDTWEERGER